MKTPDPYKISLQMKQKTAIRQAIELLEQQRNSLKEMELLGVLLENEFAHKSNQINTIQIMLSKLIPTEQSQIINFHIEVMKIGLIKEGHDRWTDSYKPMLKETAENYFLENFE